MRSLVLNGPAGRLASTLEREGPGTPVVFVHSDGGVGGHWDLAMKHLVGKRPSVKFDRRGHADSDAPADGLYDYARCAGDVLAVADACEFPRFFLVGHSGGGAIAFATAARAPERLAGLLLVDPAPDPSALPPGQIAQTVEMLRGDDYEKTISAYYSSIAGSDPKLAKRIVHDAVTTPRETMIRTTEASAQFDAQSMADRYPGPKLSVIQSPFDLPGALHRLGSGFPFKSIDGVGHWLHLGAPDRFHAILDDFLLTNDR